MQFRRLGKKITGECGQLVLMKIPVGKEQIELQGCKNKKYLPTEMCACAKAAFIQSFSLGMEVAFELEKHITGPNIYGVIQIRAGYGSSHDSTSGCVRVSNPYTASSLISWPLPSIFGNYCQNVPGLSEGLIRVMWPSKLGKSAVLHGTVQRAVWKALGR